MSEPALHAPIDSAWRRRPLVTPEGVELHFTLASAADRVGAFVLDLLIVVGSLVVLTIVTFWGGLAAGGEGTEVAGVIWLLGFFVLRNLYFVLFELSAGGATPGKRALRLRVVSRDGARLSGEAVLTRNALREMEIFLPLTLAAAAAAVGDPVDGLTLLAAFAWSGVFLFLPLFNRDRMRAGDMLAGTWVVLAPRPALLPDLSISAMARPATATGLFTAEQLAAYGIKELDILEGVLRRGDSHTSSLVAERIRRRIGWSGELGDEDFLNAYYAALRGRLEHRLLFGHRRRDKFDQA